MVDSKRIAMLGTPKCDHCRGKYCTKTEYATDRRLLDRSQCQNDARYWLWHMLYLRQNLLYRLDVRKPNNWKQRYKGIADFPGLPEDAPLLVFANKQDLSGALSADQVAEQLGLQSTRTEFDVNGMCGSLLATFCAGEHSARFSTHASCPICECIRLQLDPTPAKHCYIAC